MLAPDGEQKWPSHRTRILVKRVWGIQFATELQGDGASAWRFSAYISFLNPDGGGHLLKKQDGQRYLRIMAKKSLLNSTPFKESDLEIIAYAFLKQSAVRQHTDRNQCSSPKLSQKLTRKAWSRCLHVSPNQGQLTPPGKEHIRAKSNTYTENSRNKTGGSSLLFCF